MRDGEEPVEGMWGEGRRKRRERVDVQERGKVLCGEETEGKGKPSTDEGRRQLDSWGS